MSPTRNPRWGGRSLLASQLRHRTGLPSAAAPAPLSTGEPLRYRSIPARRRSTAVAGVNIPEALGGVDRPGIGVLKDLLVQAAAASKPSTAMLLERWRDLPEYDRLAELAMAEPLVATPEAAAKELQMAVEKLLEECGPGRRMNELLRKAEETGLNYDEKAELSLLLKSKGRS